MAEIVFKRAQLGPAIVPRGWSTKPVLAIDPDAPDVFPIDVVALGLCTEQELQDHCGYAEMLFRDLLRYNICITKDGVRVDPNDFYLDPPEVKR